MEHWQFLIQKQGERTWRLTESATVEIVEGRYRVVARSGRPDTNVEVRVTYSQRNESPLKRRVNKRSRRTNTEGLIAIIPYTYLEVGTWELGCSGDIMSDLLGKSWQHNLVLEVLPTPVVEHKGDKGDEGDVLVLSSSPSFDTVSPISLVSNNKNETEQLIAEITEEISVINLKESVDEQSNNVEPVELSKSREDTDGTASVTANHDDVNYPRLPVVKITEITYQEDSDNSVLEVQLVDESDVLDVLTVEDVVPAQISDQQISNQQIFTQGVSSNSPENIETPVWLKGETAEQILHNLIELAIPHSESLLEEKKEEYSTLELENLPILLNLETQNYFVSWGETLTISGQVELSETAITNNENYFSPLPTHLQIELRSPHNSQILRQVRQSLPENLLPFTFSSSIDIPADCDSKLILANVSLYGVLDGIGEPELLASQSFTITANLSELLAISATVTNPPAIMEELSETIPELKQKEPPVSLGLELLNLVKTPKPKTINVHPITKKTLPPRINPNSFYKSRPERSPQLPKVPGYQPKFSNTAVVVADPPKKRKNRSGGSIFPYLKRIKALPGSREEIKALSGANYPSDDNTKPIANPETSETISDSISIIQQTYIEQSESAITEFEYQSSSSLASSNVDQQNLLSSETTVKDESTLDEAPSQATLDDSVNESAQINNLKKSPLLQKWFESQGYLTPEPITVDFQDYSQEEVELTKQESIKSELTEPENTELSSPPLSPSSPLLPIPPSPPLPPPPPPFPVKRKLPIPPPPPPLPTPKVPPAWLAKEIVVDDTEEELQVNTPTPINTPVPESANQLVPVLSSFLAIREEMIESLPTPQLYVPPGELIAGQLVRVRVEIPNVASSLAVKLWMQDYQTRWLLDGPHLLTNLLLNYQGVLELTTQLRIPFGCLEIRLEAIAIDLATEQESHKATVVRTIIPPDLPRLQDVETLHVTSSI